jgi:recombinational DNA repair ATPase RecF
MFIKTFEVENYKSFLASGEIALSPGFNVIVGPNNAGRTALIEALEYRFENQPHRSQRTATNRNSQPIPTSRVKGTLG